MTTQEALEILYKGIAPNPTANNECIELCKKTLEKQIPKKPITLGFNPIKLISSVSYICPNCNTHVSTTPYCPICGQALDWSDTE